MNFLRFGEKIKKIKNKAKINKELSYRKLKEKLRNYEIKIKQLEKLNSFKNDKNNIILNSNENEVLNLLEEGINNKARLDYSINLNGNFSKSNFIFILKLIQINKKEDFFLKSELIFFNSSGEDNLFPVSNSYEKEKGPIHIF